MDSGEGGMNPVTMTMNPVTMTMNPVTMTMNPVTMTMNPVTMTIINFRKEQWQAGDRIQRPPVPKTIRTFVL